MKLYHSPLSPYVRKCKVTAAELGLDIELVEVSTTPLAPDAGLVEVNPVGRIPALVTDDGQTLMDSRVICRYLNHVAGGSLHGSGAGEFPILAREALAEGIIDSALLCSYEVRLRPEEKRHAPFTDGMRDKVRRGVAAFNARVGEMGGEMTIDKIALGCALGYIDFRLGDLGWRDANRELSDWYAAFAARPSMQATKPE